MSFVKEMPVYLSVYCPAVKKNTPNEFKAFIKDILIICFDDSLNLHAWAEFYLSHMWRFDDGKNCGTQIHDTFERVYYICLELFKANKR